jgi:AraC-like DNA-binding protein
MKSNRSTHGQDLSKLLACFGQNETASLFDFLEDTRFWIKDRKGRYLRVNRTFQLDYSLASIDEAIGLTDFDLTPPWIAEAFRADDAVVLTGKRIVDRIELVNGFDSALHWYRTHKIPLHDAAGQIGATAGMARLLPDLQAPAFPVPELAPALAALHDDSQTPWSNTALARLVGMSVSTFERQFRQHLQTSPMQFLRRLRLARAAAALSQTSNSIAEIALRFGFSDQSHLSRQFKQLYGMPPSQWRSHHQSTR